MRAKKTLLSIGALLAAIQLVPFGRDLVQRDVDLGRRVLNLSEWDRPYEEAAESAETVREGEMPPSTYLLLHPSARLSAEDARALARGLDATLGREVEGEPTPAPSS